MNRKRAAQVLFWKATGVLATFILTPVACSIDIRGVREPWRLPEDYCQVQDLSVCMCKQDSISVQPWKDQLQAEEYVFNHLQTTGQAEQGILNVRVSKGQCKPSNTVHGCFLAWTGEERERVETNYLHAQNDLRHGFRRIDVGLVTRGPMSTAPKSDTPRTKFWSATHYINHIQIVW